MVILHFACIDESKTNGVCVIVPQHVRAQKRFANTALINVNNIRIPGAEEQLPFEKPFDLRRLPKPFDHPDLVVFHECYRPAYLAIAHVLRKNKIPYVIIPHGELRAEAQQKKHLKKVAANFLLFDRFIEHAAALQCLSDDEIRATHFGKKKILGTNGIEMPLAAKTAFREKGAEFIYVGRYEWRVKGLDLLFDAIKLKEQVLRENGCSFSLYGPDVYGRFAEVSAMVRERDLGELVSLHHEILGDEKKTALLDADVFIQTSRHEGMPMGILEAMSCGLPCLITKGTSLGSVISDAHAGWTAETTAEGIAARLVEAVEQRAMWPELGRNGVAAAREHFSWDVVASDTVRQYKRLLSEV